MMRASPDEFRFLHGGHLPRCTAKVDKVFDGYYALQFMRAGRVWLRVDRGVPRLLEGSWVWCAFPARRSSYHRADASVWDHRYVAFAGSLPERWRGESLLLAGPIPCPADSVATFCEAFDSMLRWFHAPGTLAQRRARNLLENLLIDLSLGVPDAGLPRPTMKQRIVHELRRQEYRGISGSALARRFGMAESSFRRRFRRETGIPVNQFVLETRLGRARQLLLESSSTLQEIADQTGFSDVYYFSRMFARAFHMPPGRFRRSAVFGKGSRPLLTAPAEPDPGTPR